MDLAEKLAGIFADGFADEEAPPQFITRAVVVFEGMGADGERRLYTWRDRDSTMLWDAIGLMRASLAGLEHQMTDDDD